jgi:Flp pilus assembly protein TadG
MKRSREGSNAVEFALVMPVFILLIFGMMEFSWAFFVRSGVINSLRSGTRDGSVVHPDDDPAAFAEAQIEANLLLYTIDCDDLNTTCQVTCALSGSAPTEQLDCDIEVNYEPLMGGLVIAPSDLYANTSMVLELQR